MKSQSSIKINHLQSLLLLSFFVLISSGCSRSEEETVKATTAPVEAEPVEIVQSTEIPITTTNTEARALYDEGEYLVDVGRIVQAREKFKAASASDPSFALAYYGQSNAALSFEEYQKSLDTAIQHSEGISDGERMLIDINLSFTSNDAAAGLALAEKLVDEFPESARARIVLAGMQANQNDNEGARASNLKALELEPGMAAALAGLATNNLFGEPKDFAAAETWAEKFIATFPNEAKGYEILGDIKRAQNDLEAALAAYNSASRLDPTLEQAAHKRGHVNSFLGNIEEARNAYDEAIASAPPETKASYAVYKGFTNIHGGDIPAAIDELDALSNEVESMGTPADQVKGMQVFALSSASFAAMQAGMFERATDLVARRNELNMEIAQDVGTDDARRILMANNQFFYGMLAAYMGDAEVAAEHAATIEGLVTGDDDPRKLEGAHWVLGKSALQAGDYATAVSELRQADYTNNMFVRYHLALAEEGNGNTEEANKLFSEVAVFNFNSIGFALIGRDAAARIN
jgi:tetratricopeptide (TPR) repeat protein